MADPDPQRPRKRLRQFVRRRSGASRFAFEIDRAALKDGAVIVIPLFLIVFAAFWVASRYIKPAPPGTFVMSTGPEGGAYHLFGRRYREILARDGVQVDLRASEGSVENLERLADPSSPVEVALVQAGVASQEQTQDLLSLGAVYYEPLWIFYRGARDAELLSELLDRRIAIGPQGSGTRALALQLLHAVGANTAKTVFAPLGGNAAADALISGAVGAAFMVASPDAPVVQRLLRAKGIRLLSIANAEAISRHYPFLSMVKLPRGVVDLAAPLPARDITLLATTANIVVRKDFHPALAFLLLSAATELHSRSGILQRHREFPAARETEFALSEEAQRYFTAGQPFLRRYLPYWLANLVERTMVLLVPLFAVLLPAMRIVPGLMQWRAKSRVFRWYGEIKYLESELMRDPNPERVREMLARLEEIEEGVDRTPVPRAYIDYAYNLRTHIDVVRHRVQRLATGDASAPESVLREQSDSGGKPAES